MQVCGNGGVVVVTALDTVVMMVHNSSSWWCLGGLLRPLLVMNRYWMTEQAVVTCSAVMEP